ncbi:sel1 repeat family protein [Moritella marina ATCC 15381]|uniref:Sel1 repeat family protein n=1 Tax=Moritella marina ATCC 15381 TaxID=1202962 RepID=A0A5J6WNQ8_MORMI|nr:tetratricopeptide repeat protein [Moritella marina]QFI38808.1 sel1 repeat family protein [Moritella marina ATCC 15381]
MSLINKLTAQWNHKSKAAAPVVWPESAFTAEQHAARNKQFSQTYHAYTNPQQAFEFCRAQADEGVVLALYLLALQYEQGDGQQTYLSQALSCYQRAGDCGHPESLFNLALLYLQGNLPGQGPQGKPNAVLAFSYFEQAATLGLVQAQYNLASMLDQGAGCFQDQSKAFDWYNKAAEQGYTQAWQNIAVMYYRGEGVEADKLKAYAWTLLAAKAGVDEAIAAEPEMTQALNSTEILVGKAQFDHLQQGFLAYLPIETRFEG